MARPRNTGVRFTLAKTPRSGGLDTGDAMARSRRNHRRQRIEKKQNVFFECG
jgi:hypothetical protein